MPRVVSLTGGEVARVGGEAERGDAVGMAPQGVEVQVVVLLSGILDEENSIQLR